MKKLTKFLILTYLLFTINSNGIAQEKKNSKDNKTLKIGVLLPLSGKYKDIGESFLNAIELALYDVANNHIKIYPKNSKGTPLDTYNSAKEFEEEGIEIVIGPIFYENLERLNEIDKITFISLTNSNKRTSNNIITFGININSQINTIKKYLNKTQSNRTLLLSPKTQFLEQTEIFENSELKLKEVFFYNTNVKKITNEIEKLTKYRERKKDLERRIKILEKSDLHKHKKELEKLEQMHTLGQVNFDTVIVLDFGERLKSVLTSFIFSDVTSEKVDFFTVNQWFDETLFNESALQNLYFPAIDLNNLKKFNKKYIKKFNKKPNEVSILAYDALGLIYYCWFNNNFQFKKDQLYNKKGFKGLHGEFNIENNASIQKLKIYKVSGKKFIKVH